MAQSTVAVSDGSALSADNLQNEMGVYDMEAISGLTLLDVVTLIYNLIAVAFVATVFGVVGYYIAKL